MQGRQTVGRSMTGTDALVSPAEQKRRRHKVARRLYEQLLAQNQNRVLSLRDGGAGKVVSRHDPLPEHDAPQIAPVTHGQAANGHDR